MRARAAPTLAWSLAAISVACCAFGLWSFAQVPLDQVGGPEKFWPQVTSSLGMLAYGVVGGLMAARRPTHPIGWLFLAAGLAYQTYTLVGGIATSYWWARVQPAEPMASLLLWGLTLWSVSGGLLPLIMLLFPDGRLPSPRWRVGVWLTMLALVLSLLSVDGAFGPWPRPSPSCASACTTSTCSSTAPWSTVHCRFASSRCTSWSLAILACCFRPLRGPSSRYLRQGSVRSCSNRFVSVCSALSTGCSSASATSPTPYCRDLASAWARACRQSQSCRPSSRLWPRHSSCRMRHWVSSTTAHSRSPPRLERPALSPSGCR